MCISAHWKGTIQQGLISYMENNNNNNNETIDK